MAAENLDSALKQMRDEGLLVEANELVFDRLQRVRVEGGGKEKRGWYKLVELPSRSGSGFLIFGSFGVYHGAETSKHKITIDKGMMPRHTAEEREALRIKRARDQAEFEREQRESQERAAKRAAATWARLSETGESAYLAAKGVRGLGCRYTPDGTAVIPMHDGLGRVSGLQFLRTQAQAEKLDRPTKQFWPFGAAKKGRYFLTGPDPGAAGVILVGEGYATLLSANLATGLPIATAMDAGNLLPVCVDLGKLYPAARLVVLADDDVFASCKECEHRLDLRQHAQTCPACGKPHGRSNAGVNAAMHVAAATGATWLKPTFSDDAARTAQFFQHGRKLTDFNDLHATDGLPAVRAQIEAHLAAHRVRPRDPAASQPPAGGSSTSGGGCARLRPVSSVDEILRRYALVYGHGGAVFDHDERSLVKLQDLRDICTNREMVRWWLERSDRQVVRIDNVGFDPTERAPGITCNLWHGWPTKPAAGSCEKLLEVLRHMCSDEDGLQHELYTWVLRWLALPIQRPGAKMRTCLVVHGPQGVGKNLFFEAVAGIYGRYASVLDQNALVANHNEWASRKLFLICDEVVARNEVWHLKNMLKGLITGTTVRINPKHVMAYEEANHMNLVFLSNEVQPVALDTDDRRHTVIWTPVKLSLAFYREVQAEIEAGGIAALHHHLLNVDLGDFDVSTAPLMTKAKRDLVALGRDSVELWFEALMDGDVVESVRPALASDAFAAYQTWCQRNGTRSTSMQKFSAILGKKFNVTADRCRWNGSLVGRPGDNGPHSFLFWPGVGDPPAGETRAMWLGKCVANWRSQHADELEALNAA